MWRVGILNEASTVRLRPEVVQSLAQRGLVEGRNLTLDFRSSMGDPAVLRDHAEALVRTKPDVILAPSTRPAVVLKSLTSTIPIVVSSADPVGAGLVASFARPGGNVTGTLIPLIELAAKRMHLLHEIAPAIRSVAILWNPEALTTREQLLAATAVADKLGLRTTAHEAGNQNALKSAFAHIAADRPDALIVMQDPFLLNAADALAAFAREHRLPASHPYPLFVQAGGLFSYGIMPTANSVSRAAYVEKILKGASPAELPVTQTDRFDLVIHAGTARALGLVIPRSVRLQATQVIE